jgi:hypothetical protein
MRGNRVFRAAAMEDCRAIAKGNTMPGKQHGLTDRQDDHAVRRERRATLALIGLFLVRLVCHDARHPMSMLLHQAEK